MSSFYKGYHWCEFRLHTMSRRWDTGGECTPLPSCVHTILQKKYTHEAIWTVKAFTQSVVQRNLEELFLTENNWCSDTFSIWRWYYVIPCFCTPFSVKPCHRQNSLNSTKYSILGYKSFIYLCIVYPCEFQKEFVSGTCLSLVVIYRKSGNRFSCRFATICPGLKFWR